MALLHRVLLFFRGGAAFALSFALVAAGCESEVAIRPAASVERSGAASVAQALAADPELLDVVELGVKMGADLHAFAGSLSGEELDSILQTLEHPQFQANIDLPTLLTNLGSDTSVFNEMRTHIENLVARHGLQDASPQQVQNAFSAALSSQNMVEALEAFIEEQLANDTDPDVQACEEQCELAHDVLVGVAIVAYIAALAASVSQGIAGVAWAIAATAAFMQTVTLARAVRDRCIEECNGIFDDDCNIDPDCGSNEYCWTGVLGVGKNECRSKKNESKTCARDGQCKSGCCKYHFPTNPVSQTCRPASKCD